MFFEFECYEKIYFVNPKTYIEEITIFSVVRVKEAKKGSIVHCADGTKYHAVMNAMDLKAQMDSFYQNLLSSCAPAPTVPTTPTTEGEDNGEPGANTDNNPPAAENPMGGFGPGANIYTATDDGEVNFM